MIKHRVTRLRRSLLIAAASLVFLPPYARAVTTTWISPTGGSFSAPANWSDGLPNPTTPALFAIEPSSNPVILFPSNVLNFNELAVRHPGLTFDLQGHVLDVFSSASAQIDVSAPIATPAVLTLTSSGVGLSGTMASPSVYLGRLPDTAGSLTLDGAHVSLSGTNLYVGHSGTGSLALTNSARVFFGPTNVYVGYNPGSAGSVSLSTGTALNVPTLSVGESGTGSLTAAPGSTLTAGTFTYIGRNVGSTGSVSLSAGSRLTAFGSTGSIQVGGAGVGSLSLSGATASLSDTALTVGHSAGSSGIVSLSNGSSMSAFTPVYIGESGAGSLSLSNSTGPSVTLAHLPGSTGTATVTDGSVLGVTTVADAGAASVSVTGNSLLTSTDATVGKTAGANGAVTVAGLGSGWTLTNQLTLAPVAGSTASLTITGGGSVRAGTLSAGAKPGASAVITVAGTNSLLATAGAMTIGPSASLSVGPGGVLTAGSLSVGGAVRVQAGGTITGGAEELNSINVSPGGTLTYAAPAVLLPRSVTNNGVIAAPAAPGDFLEFLGTVYGGGSFTGNVVFAGGLTAQPSPSSSVPPTTLSFENAFFTPVNTLTIRLTVTQSSHLLFNGPVTLAGTLDFEPTFPFAPAPGQSYDLFDFNGPPPVGTFRSITLPRLPSTPPGLRWDTSELYTTGILRVIPEPSSLPLLLGPLLRRWRRHPAP